MTDLLKELRRVAQGGCVLAPGDSLRLLDALERAMAGLERVAQADSGDGVDEFAECIYGARDAMRAIRKRLGGEHGG